MKLVQQIEMFAAKNFADHVITKRHESDVTRYYRCQKPGTWCYGFDVTFTPGWVFLTGDIGHLALSRELDMLPFIRGVLCKGTIDFRYVAEKAPQCIRTRQWDREAAVEALDSVLDEDCPIEYEKRLALYEFTDKWEWDAMILPELSRLDIGEIDPTDWTPEFLWCVYGLRQFVRLLDQPTERRPE